MSITFSNHAQTQLLVRVISKEIVIEAIKNPDSKSKSFKSRLLRQKHFNGKILEVVTKTEGSRITVITAYYLEVDNEN